MSREDPPWPYLEHLEGRKRRFVLHHFRRIMDLDQQLRAITHLTRFEKEMLRSSGSARLRTSALSHADLCRRAAEVLIEQAVRYEAIARVRPDDDLGHAGQRPGR